MSTHNADKSTWTTLKYGSVCSGIEAASAAWLPLGWRASFLSEIDSFPRAVLAHHYGDTALHGDFTTIQAGQYDPIDILVGGTPCQSFSVAGLRGGLADERGNLALEYLRLAERLRPRWLVWENVPGVLSSGAGRDFGAFVGGLVELGYGFAYRILDAQYFGLAQRRKRVFVVGCLGDWRRAAAVLFEPASLRGHPAPRREARERFAASLTRSADSGGKGGYAGRRREDDVNLVANPLGAKRDGGWRGDLDNDTYTVVSNCLSAHGGSGRIDAESETFVCQTADSLTVGANQTYGFSGDNVAHSLRADGFDASEDGTGRGTPLVFDTTQITSPVYRSNNRPGDPCHTLAKGAHAPAIAFQDRFRGDDGRGYDRPPPSSEGVTGALETVKAWNVASPSAVRRLTPVECERLQGFPDGYTDIVYRGKPAADGPRYRALGNSMAVPVMAWIGRRLLQVAEQAHAE